MFKSCNIGYRTMNKNMLLRIGNLFNDKYLIRAKRYIVNGMVWNVRYFVPETLLEAAKLEFTK